MARATMALLTFSRVMFLAFTGYLLLSDNARPAILIPLILLWGLGEGLALPLWTSFLAGMVHGSERGRWVDARSSGDVADRARTGRDSGNRCSCLKRAGTAVCICGRWLGCGAQLVHHAPDVRGLGRTSGSTQARVNARTESPEARRFLTGVFMFWFASALTWPIVPKYIMTDLHAPTAYFAVSQIVGAMIGVVHPAMVGPQNRLWWRRPDTFLSAVSALRWSR